ncbi:MAG: PEP-CTERM sorting domain-containing protein, partial [Opitutales bacterium]
FETTFDDGNGDIDTALSTLNNTLGGVSWSDVPEADGLVANNRDYNLGTQDGPPGSTPLLLVATSSSFNNIEAGDEVGLVSPDDFTIADFGTTSIGFEDGAEVWDTAHIGALGSLTLEAVPEPSTYAALVGLCVFVFVSLRRRR